MCESENTTIDVWNNKKPVILTYQSDTTVSCAGLNRAVVFQQLSFEGYKRNNESLHARTSKFTDHQADSIALQRHH